MKRAFGLSAVLLLAATTGLALYSRAEQTSPDSRKARQSTPPAVIGILETRSHRIELKSGGCYTIRTRSGRIVAKDVTLQTLRASNPKLHGILERAVANPRRNNDAGLPPSLRNPSSPPFEID
jgi:hypothetical protein